MKKSIKAVVNLASPVHQTPHTGFAQIIPDSNIPIADTIPTSANDTDI